MKKKTVAEFISEKITASGKPQLQIAVDCDWPKPNMITMVKQGKTKIPLEKVGLLAASLEIDAKDLLRRCMQEYMPGVLEVVEAVHPGLLLSHYEHEIIEAYRAVAGNKNFSVGIFPEPYSIVQPLGDHGDSQWVERGPHAQADYLR